jgi:hypothetical protein
MEEMNLKLSSVKVVDNSNLKINNKSAIIKGNDDFSF